MHGLLRLLAVYLRDEADVQAKLKIYRNTVGRGFPGVISELSPDRGARRVGGWRRGLKGGTVARDARIMLPLTSLSPS